MIMIITNSFLRNLEAIVLNYLDFDSTDVTAIDYVHLFLPPSAAEVESVARRAEVAKIPLRIDF